MKEWPEAILREKEENMFRFREVEQNWDTEKEVTREQPYMQIKPTTEKSSAELMKEVEAFWREEFRKAHEEALKES